MAFGDTYDLDEKGQPKYPSVKLDTGGAKKPPSVRPTAPKSVGISDENKRRIINTLNQGGELSDTDRKWVENQYGVGQIQRFGGSSRIDGGAVEGGAYWARKQGKNWEPFSLQNPKLVVDAEGRSMQVPTNAAVVGESKGGLQVDLAAGVPKQPNQMIAIPYFGANLPPIPSVVSTKYPIPSPESVQPEAPDRRYGTEFYNWLLGRGAPNTGDWSKVKMDDIKDFFQQYYRSPRFAQMYANQWDQAPLSERFGTIPRQVVGEVMAQRIQNADVRHYPTGGGPALPGGTSYYVGPGQEDYPNLTTLLGGKANEHIALAPQNDDEIYKGWANDPNFEGPAQSPIGAHEKGHLGFKDIMPQSQQDYLKANQLPKGSKARMSDHARSPGETRADVMSLRYVADRLGIYNPMKEGFTVEHLKKLQNLPPQYSGFSSKLQRLLEVYSPEMLIWIMNNVAENKQGNQTPDNYV